MADSIFVSALQLEWLSPLGLVLAGRTAGDWGLGLVANSGNCADCDSLQTVDRIGLVTSLLGALVALSYDFDANGGHAGSWPQGAGLLHDLTDRDDLRTVNLAVARYFLPGIAARHLRSGRVLFNWGVAASFRWQDEDLPGYYLTPLDEWAGTATADELVARGLEALLADCWFRVATGSLLVEGEAAYLRSTIESASLLAGVATSRVTADQFGGVLRLRWRLFDGLVALGADAGLASGDDAPGFGANPGCGFEPHPGDLDGNQLSFNGARPDLTLNNFRFNENFHFVDGMTGRRQSRSAAAA